MTINTNYSLLTNIVECLSGYFEI